jgi:hypothetical protein
MAAILLMEWFYHHFIPEVKNSLEEKGLVIDSAPGHPESAMKMKMSRLYF